MFTLQNRLLCWVNIYISLHINTFSSPRCKPSVPSCRWVPVNVLTSAVQEYCLDWNLQNSPCDETRTETWVRLPRYLPHSLSWLESQLPGLPLFNSSLQGLPWEFQKQVRGRLPRLSARALQWISFPKQDKLATATGSIIQGNSKHRDSDMRGIS